MKNIVSQFVGQLTLEEKEDLLKELKAAIASELAVPPP